MDPGNCRSKNTDVPTIEIPLKDTDEVIEIQLSKLPGYEEVLGILESENSNLNLWIDLAFEYYKSENPNALVKLLERSRSKACISYKDSDKDQMRALDMLGAYYVRTANQEKNKDKRVGLLGKAAQLYTTADKIKMYDMDHLLCRAYFCLSEGNKVDQADTQFNFILNQSADNIAAQLGKANIAYNRQDYKGALAYFKKALRFNPNLPAEVRVGLAHCFLKLGNEEKARLAMERALQLNPKCVNALVGLAVMKLNGENPGDIKQGVTMLSEAYNIDPNHPMVLNHLSNHFFYKKDYVKSELLARNALQNTENEAMRAESCYHLARAFHVQGNYDKAFQYYYQSTQFASTTFVLPHYGLGQLYIHGGDMENAAQCFEKVLMVKPDNYECMKILSSLYASTNNQQKRDIAKSHLKKITERFPEDLDAWIEMAQILEQSDLQGSLSAYNKAIDLMQTREIYIGPEILNNIAAIQYRLGNLDESRYKLEESLTVSKKMVLLNSVQSDIYFSVTTTYNMARLCEAQCQFQKAEILYKDILKEHPNYIDCYLRLGCMARDRNQIYEASDWFKEALRIDNENPNAWTLLGNLHLSKMEWGPGQRKFERILRNPSTINDPYALISMGNVWLQTLYQSISDQDKKKKNQNLAIQFYTKVLKSDPKNIWAAHGIGCVLAHKNYIHEARDIFDQVREATANFSDVWLNIAHIYVEQKLFVNAIQMYQNCMKKFFKHDNVEVLQYLGRVYVKAGKLKEAKTTFLKARRVAPNDTAIMYNIAFVLQKLSLKILEDEKSNLDDVIKAVNELEIAQRYFQFLASNGDRKKYEVTVAEREAEACKEMMIQAEYHITRARKNDFDERETRRKQDEERKAIREKQIEEQNTALKLYEDHQKKLLLQRNVYIEKTKHATVFNKLGHKRSQNSASGGSDDSDPGESTSTANPTKSKTSGQKKGKKVSAKRQRKSEFPGRLCGDIPTVKRVRQPTRKKDHSLSAKQSLKIVSKATISTSDESSDDSMIKRVSGQKLASIIRSSSESRSGSEIQGLKRASRSQLRSSGSKSKRASRSRSRSSNRSNYIRRLQSGSTRNRSKIYRSRSGSRSSSTSRSISLARSMSSSSSNSGSLGSTSALNLPTNTKPEQSNSSSKSGGNSAQKPSTSKF